MRFVLAVLTVFYFSVEGDAFAQSDTSFTPQPDDGIADFVKARKLSSADLEKKREGVFITGLPDISSDPVNGFGFGVRGNIFWNGNRTNPLFAYTPYFVKLRVNAYLTTAEAKELALSLDIPYVNGSRWRIKIDAKVQQNPNNLYFGLTEATLGDLRLPSNNRVTYSRYEDFDKARKTLRAGSAGEASSVTDALSNRFNEDELMLNVKADYSLGDGRWRVLAGYEIQRLSYTTFTGKEAEAIDPATGNSVTAPNGLSLLERDANTDLVEGLEGGRVSILQQALIYDTRDFEPDPSSGMYAELANELSLPLIGSEFTFNKLFFQLKTFHQLGFGQRTVLAARLGIGNIFGDDAPFFEFQDQWSPDGSINSLGGSRSLRGFRANRFLARSLWFTNVELRYRIGETLLWNERFSLTLSPFLDAGTVRDRWQTLNFSDVKFSYGAGTRIAWNQSTVITLDVGFSNEDRLLFFGIGQIF